MASAESITAIRVITGTTCRFTNDVLFTEISIHGVVGVIVEDSYENNQKVFTTTATFQTCDKLPQTERRMAFRMTGIDEKRYMIGTDSRPFPIIKERNPYPERPADSSLKTVTITWRSLLPMLLIEE